MSPDSDFKKDIWIEDKVTPSVEFVQDLCELYYYDVIKSLTSELNGFKTLATELTKKLELYDKALERKAMLEDDVVLLKQELGEHKVMLSAHKMRERELTAENASRQKFIKENYPSDYEDIKRERDELKKKAFQCSIEAENAKLKKEIDEQDEALSNYMVMSLGETNKLIKENAELRERLKRAIEIAEMFYVWSPDDRVVKVGEELEAIKKACEVKE